MPSLHHAWQDVRELMRRLEEQRLKIAGWMAMKKNIYHNKEKFYARITGAAGEANMARYGPYLIPILCDVSYADPGTLSVNTSVLSRTE